MLMTATVPIGDLGTVICGGGHLDMGGSCCLVVVGDLRSERVGLVDAIGTGSWRNKEAGA